MPVALHLGDSREVTREQHAKGVTSVRGGERKGEPWRTSALGRTFLRPSRLLKQEEVPGSIVFEPRGNWGGFSDRTFPANYTTVFLMCFKVKYRVVDGFSSRRNQQKK